MIEHFDTAGPQRAIDTHFSLLKPGGWALISFPTPTWLYRAARSLAEAAGLWKFPDERPLLRDEGVDTLRKHGDILHGKRLWPIVFTQRLILMRKRS